MLSGSPGAGEGGGTYGDSDREAGGGEASLKEAGLEKEPESIPSPGRAGVGELSGRGAGGPTALCGVPGTDKE